MKVYNLITLLIWFVLLGGFNAVYLSIQGKLKEVSYKKFLIFNSLTLLLYTVAVAFSVLYFTQNATLFRSVNFILIFVTGFMIDKFLMNEDNKQSIIYGLVFAGVFNLFWYELLGII